MSDEEDKSGLNDVDSSNASRPNDGDDDSGIADGPPDTLTINCNASSPPCQLDIGLGTHTDSRRLDNNSNANGKTHILCTILHLTNGQSMVNVVWFMCNHKPNFIQVLNNNISIIR